MAPEARSSGLPYSADTPVPLVSERLVPLLAIHRQIMDARARRDTELLPLYFKQEKITRELFEERQQFPIPGMTVALSVGIGEISHVASRNEFHIVVADVTGRGTKVVNYVNSITSREYPDSLAVLKLIGEPDVVVEERPARYLRRTWEEVLRINRVRGEAYKREDFDKAHEMDRLRVTLAMRYLYVRAQKGKKDGIPPIIIECVEDRRRGDNRSTSVKVTMVDNDKKQYSITIPSVVRLQADLQEELDRLIAETGGYDVVDNLA